MRINRCRTLEDQIRKLKRDMSAITRKLDEMKEEIKGFRKETNEHFVGLEDKLGRTFNVVADGFKAAGHDPFTIEIKEIWKKKD